MARMRLGVQGCGSAPSRWNSERAMVQAVSALPPFPADSTCRAPHCLHLLGYAVCLSTLRQENLCATLFCLISLPAPKPRLVSLGDKVSTM